MLINTQSEIDSKVRQMLNEVQLPQPASLEEKLKANNLGTEECIEHLADIARNGESRDAIRLRAIETGLKLNGVLKEAERPIAPTFTIVINDPGALAINPILIPRTQN